MSVTLDPPLDGFSAEDGARGTLYVIESALYFMSFTSGRGLQIDYPAITLHAISRAESGPCVYCQIDDTAGQAAANGVAEETQEYTDMRELTIIPQQAESLEPIFEALSLCASLHPDPNDDDDDAMLDDALIDGQAGEFETFTGGEDEELSEVGRAALAHLESIIVYPEGQKPAANGADGVSPEGSPGPEEKASA